MGITGELVRSVFSRNRSIGSHDTNVRGGLVDRKRWTCVRSYLCGDEFNSVLAEEDSASVKSSEATVTQPAVEDVIDREDVDIRDRKQDGKQNSIPVLFREEDAAISIQSAFRDFLARRRNEGVKTKDSEAERVGGNESPSKESMATSLEVQTSNSVEVFLVGDENMSAQYRMQQKARNHVLRLKEDWDDSTVSSNISKLRIQNRLEATTRRERALAYAFSQQLRICSKKRQTRSDDTEPNMGWSWLERWMATRLPESSCGENHMTKMDPISGYQEFTRVFDFAGEEKESCGSNEVPVLYNSFPLTSAHKGKDRFRPTRNRLKATSSVSRLKTMPSYKLPRQYAKASNNDCLGEPEKGKKHKNKHPRSKIECKSAFDQ